MRIVGVLLAAGQGTRFGGDKLLARLADGTPVGVMAARNLAAALHEAIAVVRPEDVRLAQLLGIAGIAVEPCPSAWQGMGSSLAHAVRARPDADGWIVALADMPKVRPETSRSSAAPRPTMRGRTQAMPYSAIRPRRANAVVNLAPAAAKRTSQ